MTRVAIVDYGMCNLDSIQRAVQECGGDPYLVQHAAGLDDADRIVEFAEPVQESLLIAEARRYP